MKAIDEKTAAFIESLCSELTKNNAIKPEYYDQYNVKRGLRNPDGTGVVAGITHICNVHGYVVSEGERIPYKGELTYRGYNVEDLVAGYRSEDRYGFEETAFLLLFGVLPTKAQLDEFCGILDAYAELPDGFIEDTIMKVPSLNIMNKLASCVLSLYVYDDDADDETPANVMNQCISLVARIPGIAVSAYQVKKRHFDKRSLYFHYPKPGLSMAENILHMLRSDKKYTQDEAHLLDLCLILQMEHGGGNNSTFATRILTSAGTDTYSAMAAAIGSLKGSKHGGANAKVTAMIEDIKANVSDWGSDALVEEYLTKMVQKKVGDRSGLIYGMGHAVYTLSDPRAVMLKEAAEKLALEKDMSDEYRLIEAVERLTPKVFAAVKGDSKVISANVDLYTGFVYKMLGIPAELNTPLFAMARIVGWSAHRLEELMTCNRIIRPAYKAIAESGEYIPISKR